MKRIAYLLLLLPTLTFGQHLSELSLWNQDSSSKNNIVFLNGTGLISSNGMRSNLYNKFIVGGYISQELKNSTLFDLETSNRLGANVTANIGFISDLSGRFGHGLSSIISYKQVVFNDAKLTAEIPDLILNGNTKFLGRTVSLGNNSYQSLRYSSLSFGLMKTAKKADETYRIGAMLGYIMGISHQSVDISSGKLEFAADGSAIDLSATYRLAMSDTSNSRWLNGNGMSASFFYQFIKGDKYAFSLSIDNLRFIKWNEDAMSEQKRSEIHFEGFQINDIIHFSDDGITQTADSIKNSLYYPTKNGSYTSRVPCKIALEGKIRLSKYVTLAGSVWQTVYSVQKPGIIIKPVITNLIPTIDFAPYFISNGYSPYDLGFEVTAKTIKNMLIKASIYSIPVNSHTLGGEILVGYRF
jgi:hypothetical protein